MAGAVRLVLRNPPVDALDLPLLLGLRDQLTRLTSTSPPLLIASAGSRPGVFSAGLDLRELQAGGGGEARERRAEHFHEALLDVWQLIATAPVPVTAAITGYCGAGATALCLAAEWRVMVAGAGAGAGAGRIGLNDTPLGVAPAGWLHAALAHVVGERRAMHLATTGYMCAPDEALQWGLVDEVVADEREAVARCEEWGARTLAGVERDAYRRAKLSARAGLLRRLRDERPLVRANVQRHLRDRTLQAHLQRYVDGLRRRRDADTE